MRFERDDWNAIEQGKLGPGYKRILEGLMRDASRARGWEFGIEGDADDWSALNYAVYGLRRNPKTSRWEAVVQIRTANSSKYGMQVRKTYHLIQRSGRAQVTVFDVPALTVRSAVRHGKEPLAACIKKLVKDGVIVGEAA